ncbi:ornithine cyclodeaminase family protein [Elusimicrobiota bacterium]
MKKVLILSQNEIKRLIKIKEANDIIEKAFFAYGKKRVRMPAKIYLDLPEYNGDFRAMPAYIKDLEACGIKWVCSYSDNRKHKLPSVMATIILNDPKNAYPLAILEATHLTNLRTGAAGAAAAKYLAKNDSKVLSLVGCGVQAKFQMLSLKENFRFESVKIWGVTSKEMQAFKKEMQTKKIEVIPSKNIKECVSDADIVCTTTPSRKPLVKLSWLKKGAHINAIGADAEGKQELDSQILKNSVIVVDDYKQASHSGEINVPLKKKIISKRNIYANIGEIVSGSKKAVDKDRLTVFDSTGLAIQDVAVSRFIYDKAKKKKAGNWLNLF